MTKIQNAIDPPSENTSARLNIEQKRLVSLIEFAQQSARLKLCPIKEVSKHNIFTCFENDLIGLPGIHFNAGGENDEVWLVIERLWESKSPSTSTKLLSTWLDISNNPEKEPTLKKFIETNNLDEDSSDSNNKTPSHVTLIQLSDLPQRESIENQLSDYIEKYWRPWSVEEKKRRRTIKFYAELFTLKQQLEGSITDTQIEIVWGIGIALWKTSEFHINYPLIIQLANIYLNENNMSIEIRPSQTDTHLELDIYSAMNNPGTNELEKISHAFFEQQSQAFSPFDRLTYEPLLKNSVTYLDSKGVYWPNQTNIEDRQLPKATEELKVTDTWVLYARPRSRSLFIQDLENFKSQINNNEEHPSSAVEAIIKEPLSEHETATLPNFRGLCTFGSSNNTNSKAMDLYFPLPYNPEQVSILQRLERHNGVVVQGPPGTGKTHTIANIISHYMANGKRVLVTCMKEPALSVLKEKLPTEIQPLAISLLTNELDGMKQFDFAVSKIAQELQTIDRQSLFQEIEKMENYIDKLHAKIAAIDTSIDEWAKKILNPLY